MNVNQITLYERAGELSRRFQELWKQTKEKPGPDRPWFFHPFGYFIDLGYSGEKPEYDPPTVPIDFRTAQFARQIGMLSRTTRPWLNEETLRTARNQLPPHLEIESRRLAEQDMKDVPMPVKPDKKESGDKWLEKELNWRIQWKRYEDQLSAIQTDHRIRLLLKWFKEDFFVWVNDPKCVVCKGDTLHAGVAAVNSEEGRFTARDVELWRCSRCNRVERFPRYNDPVKLLSTRRGRCGEFANCFSLLVRSTGVETRWVWNAEDHVWVEYYSPRQKRWIHLDPCENAYDDPLIYARNWRKKMSYCIAFDEYGGMDVTHRYVRRAQEEGLPRALLNESHVDLVFQVLRNFRRSSLTMKKIQELEKRDKEEMKELAKFIEDERLATASPVRSGHVGRETGTADWKKARGEDGTQH